ncbi:MAG: aromatic ring-hydroxylating dioxygenase subunit alpha [Cyanobacteria bacterium P01_D01_bin.44]
MLGIDGENTTSLKASRQRIFNQSERFAQGWYWAMPSRALRAGRPQAVTLLGRELVIYRGESGEPVALDAYCPHMGASLAQGKIEQGQIRCPLHHWKFDQTGACVAVPGAVSLPDARVQSWPTAERYGLVWVWTGEKSSEQPEALPPLPHVPELGDRSCDAILSSRFRRNCHPNVLLINAIDAHHFNSVHELPLEIRFETQTLSQSAMQFNNTTRGGEASRFVRLIRPLYQNEVTYRLCYWYGGTGTVTLGPDFLHFYLMFALRPAAGGTTEGWMILLTPKRSGSPGWLFNRAVLGLTQIVANYFAKGDRQVFEGIRFDFKTPLQADRSILQFMQHVERQPALAWKTWRPLT